MLEYFCTIRNIGHFWISEDVCFAGVEPATDGLEGRCSTSWARDIFLLWVPAFLSKALLVCFDKRE